MNRSIKASILAAAVAAMPLFFSTSAHAQYRVGDDGHALDASNRVGSGGNNPQDSYKRVGDTVSGNDIVNGNVSGGKQFRGHVPYSDPREFRGHNTGVNLDAFIRQSSGSDSRLAQETRPFYGAGRGVAPPPGYVETNPGSGAYVAPAFVPPPPRSDTRIGAIDLNNPNVMLPQPGELLLAGQVDPTSGQTFITASPTAGIRMFNPSDITGMTSNTQYNPVGTRLDQNAINRMRDEMNNEAGITSPAAPAQATGTGAATPGPGANAAQGATPIQQQPVMQPNLAKPMDTSINTAASGGVGQGLTNRLTDRAIPAPDKQSAVYAVLLKQYQESLDNPALTDEQKARQLTALQGQAAKDQAAAAATPAQPAPGAIPPPPGAAAPPGQGPITSGATPPAASKVPDFAERGEKIIREGVSKETQKELALKKAPVKVPSLSEGMKGKQISDLMKSAEQLMRDGKFTAALDKYDDAERVIPNNPLVNLGRANAELGASYYARAESHLRDLFTNHPELLVAQYDLTGMLGEQRLQTLIRDLKEIAKKDQKEPRPLFLLSYIAYNTGREGEAAAYLDLADKRTGGADPFFKLLRNNWALPAKPAPAAASPAEANK